MSIEVTEERDNGVLVLLPAGRLDSTNATDFETVVIDHVSNGEQNLVVDFSRLVFISSSGMRVLLIAAKKLNSSNGKLVLCTMPDHIQEIFHVSGFDQIIAICTSRPLAIAMF